MAGAPLKIELKPDEAGKRLDLVLHQRFPQYSRARLQDWIKDGRIRVNGEARRASYLVRSGESVDVEPAGPAPLHAAPEEIPLTILYEDSDLVAIDKPAGMVVHAGAGVHSGTLVNALLHRFGSLSRAAGELRPGDALPSVRQLAARLRVNPATVVQAYRDLEAEGFVELRQGAGTFVREIQPERRAGERARQATKLVRQLLTDAGRLGVSLDELHTAIQEEIGAKAS